jgi:hypothetical protein
MVNRGGRTTHKGGGDHKSLLHQCFSANSTVLTLNVAKNLAGRAATGISVGQAFQPDTLYSVRREVIHFCRVGIATPLNMNT